MKSARGARHCLRTGRENNQRCASQRSRERPFSSTVQSISPPGARKPGDESVSLRIGMQGDATIPREIADTDVGRDC